MGENAQQKQEESKKPEASPTAPRVEQATAPKGATDYAEPARTPKDEATVAATVHVRLAVAGDVCADWVYWRADEGREKGARPSARLLQDPSDYSFEGIPGGAWFLTALVRGALADAFDSNLTIELKSPDLGRPTRPTYHIRGRLRDKNSPGQSESSKPPLVLDGTNLVVSLDGQEVSPRPTGEIVFQPSEKGDHHLDARLATGELATDGDHSAQACDPDFNSREWVVTSAIVVGKDARFTGRIELAGRYEVYERAPRRDIGNAEAKIFVECGDDGARLVDGLALDSARFTDTVGGMSLHWNVDDAKRGILRPGVVAGNATGCSHCGASRTDPLTAMKDADHETFRGPQETSIELISLARVELNDVVANSLVNSLNILALNDQPSGDFGSRRVYRRTERVGLAMGSTKPPPVLSFYPDEAIPADPAPGIPSVVLLADDGLGFATNREKWKPWVDPGEKDPNALYIIKSSRRLPYLDEDCRRPRRHGRMNDAKPDSIYEQLARWDATARDRVLLVVTSESLRRVDVAHSGMGITHTVSWDSLAHDLCVAISDGKFRGLEFAGHILIQFGMAGAALISFNDDRRLEADITLVYDPEHLEGEVVDRRKFGEAAGTASVFSAALVRALVEGFASETKPLFGFTSRRKQLERGMQDGLLCSRRHYQFAFGATAETVQMFANLDLPYGQIFHNPAHKRDRLATLHEMSSNIAGTADWSLLRHAVTLDRTAHEFAEEIVRRGIRRAMLKQKLQVPIIAYGHLTAIDTKEIEGLRSLRNIIAQASHAEAPSRPACIAVFGPPGSGKSFGVKQIALAVSSQVEFITINLSQVGDERTLWERLLPVRDMNMHGKLPVVFLDEFDCAGERGRTYRWLEKLLAPMQDGEIPAGPSGSPVKLGKCILVFAGGRAHTFEEFASGSAGGDARTFRAEKGPDFISRLMGHLDVVGLNPRRNCGHGDSPQDPQRALAALRRAVMIRSLAKRDYQDLLVKDNDGEHLRIDPIVLRALLSVTEYLHGARSLEAVFRMSELRGVREFGQSHLPVWGQLKMHVSEDFRDILRGRRAPAGAAI